MGLSDCIVDALKREYDLTWILMARLAGPGRSIAESHVQELNAASATLADASSLSHAAPFLQDRKCIAKVIARLSFRVGPKLKLKFEIE